MDIDEVHERRMFNKVVFLPRNVRMFREKGENDKMGSPKFDACDETQCRFNLNSYRMVFVVNKENYLYKRDCLRKARKVVVYALFCTFKLYFVIINNLLVGLLIFFYRMHSIQMHRVG